MYLIWSQLLLKVTMTALPNSEHEPFVGLQL
jgi:hypothetical protein